MVSLIVLATVLAVCLIPITGRRLFDQHGEEDIESRENSLATQVDVEEFPTSWRVRHRTDHKLQGDITLVPRFASEIKT